MDLRITISPFLPSTPPSYFQFHMAYLLRSRLNISAGVLHLVCTIEKDYVDIL